MHQVEAALPEPVPNTRVLVAWSGRPRSNSRRLVRIASVGAAVLLLSGCRDTEKSLAPRAGSAGAVAVSAPASSHRLVLYVACTGWDVVVWINEQPAAYPNDSTTGWMDVTHFSVNGKNTFHVTGKRTSSHPDDACTIELLRSTDKGLTGNEELITEVDTTATLGTNEIDLTKEFMLTHSIRWRWQSADTIGELTADDKAAIGACVAELTSAYRSGDSSKSESVFQRWYTGTVFPKGPFTRQDEDVMRQLVSEMMRDPDYTVEALGADEVHYIVGTRLVRISGIEMEHDGYLRKPVFRVDVGPNMPVGDIRYQSLFFMKESGQWKILPSGWRIGGDEP